MTKIVQEIRSVNNKQFHHMLFTDETLAYVGIDNGVSGALAVIGNSEGSPVIKASPMPIQKARRGNEIDVIAVADWIRDYAATYPGKICVVLEEPGGSKSAQAAKSMEGSFHALRAVVALRGYRLIRVTPKSWQKKLLPNCASGDTKPRALALARQLWPQETFLATAQSRVPHDGIVDAMLLAHHGRMEKF